MKLAHTKVEQHKMKILFIDDNKEITTVFQRLMNLHKFDVTITNNGKEGLDILKNNKFDLVILDLSMPEFTGIDVLKELYILDLIKKLKIIILTATVMTEKDIIKYLQMGAKLCLRKPIKIKKLIEKIEEIQIAS